MSSPLPFPPSPIIPPWPPTTFFTWLESPRRYRRGYFHLIRQGNIMYISSAHRFPCDVFCYRYQILLLRESYYYWASWCSKVAYFHLCQATREAISPPQLDDHHIKVISLII